MFRPRVPSNYSIALIFLASGVLSAQGIQVTSAVTARLPIPGNYCTAPPPETNFLSTDNSVWLVYQYTGGTAGDSAFVEWFDPSGTLYATASYKQAGTGGNWCYAYFISIFGYPPATTPGLWRVRLRFNDTEVLSRNFTIAAAADSALALVNNTVLPQAILGAPYTVALQASGGTSPYSWKLTNGSAPPGLTLSASGVISGTPTRTGSYLLNVEATDSAR